MSSFSSGTPVRLSVLVSIIPIPGQSEAQTRRAISLLAGNLFSQVGSDLVEICFASDDGIDYQKGALRHPRIRFAPAGAKDTGPLQTSRRALVVATAPHIVRMDSADTVSVGFVTTCIGWLTEHKAFAISTQYGAHQSDGSFRVSRGSPDSGRLTLSGLRAFQGEIRAVTPRVAPEQDLPECLSASQWADSAITEAAISRWGALPVAPIAFQLPVKLALK